MVIAKTVWIPLAGAALSLGGVNLVAAASPTSVDSGVNVCVDRASNVRSATTRGGCPSGTKRVKIAVRGPEGPRGLTGPAGPAGSGVTTPSDEPTPALDGGAP